MASLGSFLRAFRESWSFASIAARELEAHQLKLARTLREELGAVRSSISFAKSPSCRYERYKSIAECQNTFKSMLEDEAFHVSSVYVCRYITQRNRSRLIDSGGSGAEEFANFRGASKEKKKKKRDENREATLVPGSVRYLIGASLKGGACMFSSP